MPLNFVPRWRLYEACGRCGVEDGGVCRSPQTGREVIKPHPGRKHKPKQYSTFTTLVRQAMQETGTSLDDLAAALGRNPRSLYHALNDTERPMSSVRAEQLLDVMGYDMQVQAVRRHPGAAVTAPASPETGVDAGLLEIDYGALLARSSGRTTSMTDTPPVDERDERPVPEPEPVPAATGGDGSGQR